MTQQSHPDRIAFDIAYQEDWDATIDKRNRLADAIARALKAYGESLDGPRSPYVRRMICPMDEGHCAAAHYLAEEPQPLR